MNESVTLRPLFGRILTILVCVIIAVALVFLVVGANWAILARGTEPLLLVSFVTWMLFWRPCIQLSPAGVVFVNVLRTLHITWPAIQRIDTKFALTLYTASGRFTSWSAPAPSRMAAATASRVDVKGLPESTFGAEGRIALGDIPTSDSGIAALHVRRAWEGYRDEGLLGAVEGKGVSTQWHWTSIIIASALVLATILSATLL